MWLETMSDLSVLVIQIALVHKVYFLLSCVVVCWLVGYCRILFALV